MICVYIYIYIDINIYKLYISIYIYIYIHTYIYIWYTYIYIYIYIYVYNTLVIGVISSYLWLSRATTARKPWAHRVLTTGAFFEGLFHGISIYKWMIWGYHHFWKPPKITVFSAWEWAIPSFSKSKKWFSNPRTGHDLWSMYDLSSFWRHQNLE